MSEITRRLATRVGVDLSKRVSQAHVVDRSGRRLLSKAMSPSVFFAWCAEFPAGCMVAMEACGGAHHVARRLRLLGLEVRLIAGQFVTPYRLAGKSGKNDANGPADGLGAGGQRGRLRAVRHRAAIRCLAGLIPSQNYRRQSQPGTHHQAGRRLPSHPADPGCQVGRDDGAPTQ